MGPLVDAPVGEEDEDDEEAVDEEQLPGEFLDARELHAWAQGISDRDRTKQTLSLVEIS
jgi:hypothetical protein